jgi:N-acetylneuraminate synthase
MTWRDMVNRVRELEAALGTGLKKVENNELETVILQRRAIRLTCNLAAGTKLQRKHLTALRPCPPDALSPEAMPSVLNARVRRALKAGEHLRWIDLE